MIYMNADQEGFDDAAATNFNQMAAIGSTPDVNVVVLLDRVSAQNNDGQPSLPQIIKVEKGVEYPGTTELELPSQFGNMGSSRTLNLFIEHCQQKHNAEKYVLVIWDHGGGTHAVGGLGDESEKTVQELRSLVSEDIQSSQRIQRMVRRVLRRQRLPNRRLYFPKLPSSLSDAPPDSDKDSFLYVTEIASCLKKRFPGDAKLAVLVFDACWMQTVENAYTLQRHVEYLVGSEGTFSINGIGYTPFLTALTNNSSCTSNDVSRYLVEGTTLSQSHFKQLTISGLDLSIMTRIGRLFKELGNRCPTDNELFFKGFRFARFLCLPFYLSENESFINIQVIDLLYFLEKLCEVLEAKKADLQEKPLDELSQEERQFLAAAELVLETVQKIIFHGHMSLIRHKSIGSLMAVHEAEQSLKTWGAHGLSIFLPEHYLQWREYVKYKEWYFLEGDKKLPFVEGAKEWISFLHRYFRWLKKRYVEVL